MFAAEENVVEEATEILRGTARKPADILGIAKKLKGLKQFGLARRLLARARKDPAINLDPKLRLKIHQESALCTYKDPDLPADSRLDRALEILRVVEDLEHTENTETLGITGAIYKRKWEVDNQKPQLERSLFYYLRGYAASSKTGQEADQGYNGINASFILDLLAHQEAKEARGAGVPLAGGELERIAARREQAREIREEIAAKVAPLVDKPDTDWLQGKWWFYSTVGEALFGLGARPDDGTGKVEYDEEKYREAVGWLKEGKRKADPPEWEYESTARQLATLARLQAPLGAAGEDGGLEGSPPWQALKDFLEGQMACVHSAFVGKIGLGLSGGGFRASLFHIGVLAKLAELDVLRRVEALSCVSGGSIVGAHYYLEVRKLLQSKPDDQITRQDYVELVKRVERDFLRGVQRNVRTRVAAGPWKNLKMIFGSDSAPLRWLFGPPYSRTMRAGELYESEIFSRVEDGEGGRERWLNELRVYPLVRDQENNLFNDEGFNPTQGNWQREAKVPILILNAATLNTGHSWHFTANYMGEPPADIDSEIDGNDRLRRMYYGQAPEGHRRVRLGYAVGASACVQDIFEPLALDGLYPERVVRLVDGGTCDNQGVGGLLEQDCKVILISDGSGQMESEKDPSKGLLGVPLRSTSILQARIREAQYEDLSARRRSRLLRGLMFVHLKADLGVDPVDWVDCPDPYDADDDDARPASRKGRLTRYGIAKDIQQCLASVRTDLDSFSDVEAFALMTSGYRQTEYSFREARCVEGVAGDCANEDWKFLAVEDGMKGIGKQYEHVKRLLGVSDMLAFKILKLNGWALALAVSLLVLGLAVVYALFRVAVLAVRLIRDRVAPGTAISKAIRAIAWSALQAVVGGDVVVSLLVVVALAVAAALLFAFFWKKTRGETLVRVVIGFAGVVTSLVAQVHLLIFDRWFLKEGSIESYHQHARSADPARAASPPTHAATAAARPANAEPPRPAAGDDGPHAPRPDAPAFEAVTSVAGIEAATKVAAPPAELPEGNGHARESAPEGERFDERLGLADDEHQD
jgi:predicted acylesterase/phospholipase RssA